MVKKVQKSTENNGEGGGATPPPQAGGKVSITLPTSSPAPSKAKELGRAYGCVWTLYDYEKYIEELRAYAKTVDYMVFGYEICPDTGRPHLQGYVHWVNKRSLGAFSSKFGDCHVEMQRGTPKQASDYCKYDDYPVCKVENKFEEFGEVPKQGARTDWAKAVDDIKAGKEITDVIEEQPQLLVNQRALREFKAMLLKPKHREVNVICIVGDAGSGKTRYAYDTFPQIYSKPRGDWWDGYSGQTEILLDDYYGYLPYCELLRVLDRYPYQVPVKGGFVQAQWDTVIITSNLMPQQWYKQGLTPALRRRLKKVIYYRVIDGVSTQETLPLEEETCDET